MEEDSEASDAKVVDEPQHVAAHRLSPSLRIVSVLQGALIIITAGGLVGALITTASQQAISDTKLSRRRALDDCFAGWNSSSLDLARRYATEALFRVTNDVSGHLSIPALVSEVGAKFVSTQPLAEQYSDHFFNDSLRTMLWSMLNGTGQLGVARIGVVLRTGVWKPMNAEGACSAHLCGSPGCTECHRSHYFQRAVDNSSELMATQWGDLNHNVVVGLPDENGYVIPGPCNLTALVSSDRSTLGECTLPPIVSDDGLNELAQRAFGFYPGSPKPVPLSAQTTAMRGVINYVGFFSFATWESAEAPDIPGSGRTVGFVYALLEVGIVSRLFHAATLPPGSILYGVERDPWTGEAGMLIGNSQGAVMYSTLPGSVLPTVPDAHPRHIRDANDSKQVQEHGVHVLGLPGDYEHFSLTREIYTWTSSEGQVFWFAVQKFVAKDGMWACYLVYMVPPDTITGHIVQAAEAVRARASEDSRRVDESMEEDLLLAALASCVTLLLLITGSSFLARALMRPLQLLETEMTSVAAMELEGVNTARQTSMLREVRNMEQAFFMMVQQLKEYRAFLPGSLRIGDQEFDDAGDEGEEPEQTALEPLEGSVLDAGARHHTVASSGSRPRSSLTEAASSRTPQAFGVDEHWAAPPGLELAGPSPTTAPLNPLRRPTKESSPQASSADSNESSHHSRSNRGSKAQARARALDLGCTFRRVSVVAVEVTARHSEGATALQIFHEAEAVVRRLLVLVMKDTAGIVLHFNADSALSTWNAHKPCMRHARLAASTAVKLSRLPTEVAVCGIGASTGQCGVGHLGLETQRASFCTGLPVLQASRLAQLAKQIKAPQLVTENLFELVSSTYTGALVDIVPLTTGSSQAVVCVLQLLPIGTDSGTAELGHAVRALRRGEAGEAVRMAQLALDMHRETPLDHAVLAHVIRVLKISMSETHSPGVLPNPYLRRYVGWQELEDVPAPDEYRDLLRTSMGRATQRLSVATSCSSGDSQGEAGRLRDEIQAARTDGSDGGALPLNFTDSRGEVWRRSEKQLGKGAFGEVWMGMAEDGALCAIKAVRLITAEASDSSRHRHRRRAPKVAESDRQIDDLITEVAIMGRLRHENIVMYMSSAVIHGHVVLVMEYVPGGSLDAVLRQFGALAVPSVRRYVKDILRGLAFLHSNEIVHRDFKPGNVLLMIDGMCKLADFGASAELQHLAGSSAVVGTPLYMAPEACTGNVSAKSDIWGVGIATCEMITGRVPYEFTPERPYDPRTFVFMLPRDPTMHPKIPESDSLTPQALDFLNDCLRLDGLLRPSARELLISGFFV